MEEVVAELAALGPILDALLAILDALLPLLGVLLGAAVAAWTNMSVQKRSASAALEQQRREHRREEYADSLLEVRRRWRDIRTAADRFQLPKGVVQGEPGALLSPASSILLLESGSARAMERVIRLMGQDYATAERRIEILATQDADEFESAVADSNPLVSEEERADALRSLRDAMRADLGLGPLGDEVDLQAT